MDKVCARGSCHNSRVTFEDAVIMRRLRHVIKKTKPNPDDAEPQNVTYFGFLCDQCKRTTEKIILANLNDVYVPMLLIQRMSVLEYGEDEYPEHAQSRLAMMKLAPEVFADHDLGYKNERQIVVYVYPPKILEEIA